MKNENLEIRPFDLARDIEPLSVIWFEASLRAHPFIGETRLREQRKLIEEEYLPNSETWVACRAGQPLGFISLIETFIGGLFIAPDHQGDGVGRKLVEHAKKLKGDLSLEVYTENLQAVRFYEALGFREMSRRDVDDSGYPYPNAALQLKG